jgi:hypothetical protein
MGFKIDIKKYKSEYSGYSDHIKKLVEETVSDVVRSGKANKIQEGLLFDLELIVRTSGMGESSFSSQEITGEQNESEEVSEKTILGMYDFVDSEKDDASRRRAFWLLIHQVNQEMIKDIGNSKADLNLIVPEHFIPILDQSVAFISATDERLGGVDEFKGERISYEGRLNDSNYTIYSIEKKDCIYITLKIKIK